MVEGHQQVGHQQWGQFLEALGLLSKPETQLWGSPCSCVEGVLRICQRAAGKTNEMWWSSPDWHKPKLPRNIKNKITQRWRNWAVMRPRKGFSGGHWFSDCALGTHSAKWKRMTYREKNDPFASLLPSFPSFNISVSIHSLFPLPHTDSLCSSLDTRKQK